jgi:hypothetical protein
MNFQARFGTVQTSLGVQFYNSSGELLGARVTAGIVAMPEVGTYGVSLTPPAGAVGIYWNDTVTLATAIGSLSVGTITAQTNFAIDALKADATVETGDLSSVYWDIIE